MATEIRVPTLGESVTEATVATWFKKPGEAVAVDEMLCELETDKVTVEVPSPAAGTLADIVAGEGETVGVDALLATQVAAPVTRTHRHRTCISKRVILATKGIWPSPSHRSTLLMAFNRGWPEQLEVAGEREAKRWDYRAVVTELRNCFQRASTFFCGLGRLVFACTCILLLCAYAKFRSSRISDPILFMLSV